MNAECQQLRAESGRACRFGPSLDWSIGLTALGEVVWRPKTPDCITEVALFVPNDFPTLALEHPVLLALPGV
jgi:hypothetical protein